MFWLDLVLQLLDEKKVKLFVVGVSEFYSKVFP